MERCKFLSQHSVHMVASVSHEIPTLTPTSGVCRWMVLGIKEREVVERFSDYEDMSMLSDTKGLLNGVDSSA